MIDINQNQPLFNPTVPYMPTNMGVSGNEMFLNQPGGMNSMPLQKKAKQSPLSRIPSLHLPAIILLAFAWLLQTLATFLPYWSTYSGIDDSRAGLWSAQNFNFWTIQNFYFPQPTDFPNLTHSISFTTANTKAYIVTVQFLMTFNFVLMFLVLIALTADYVFSQQTRDRPWSLLMRDYNTSDTAIKYGLVLYILYVFIIFEFAAWITYVGSRHDNNWTMHVSFAFAIIVSVFLIAVFIMYLIEFLKRFQKNRLKWDYWYGPYIEWGFFVYLSALLLLLIVICCPEWAYAKDYTHFIFPEIGLFKQCFLSSIYKKAATSGYCTLSNSKNNKAWVDATQAFMLMAYIAGMIILIVIVIFRKEFRHNATGYYATRLPQPTFTYIIAGLILFFCFIFTLIGISIFGGEVFDHPLNVNWGYIVAIIAMLLFLITGILFILDAVHSGKQTAPKGSKKKKSFFFPAPLNDRVIAMQPLLRPEQAWPSIPPAPPVLPMQQLQVLPPAWPPMYPPVNFPNPPIYPFEQPPMMMPPPNYPLDPYSNTPFTQAAVSNYIQQMLNSPQLSSPPYNQGLMNYSPDNSLSNPNNRDNIIDENYLSHMVRRHFLQQQRLNYNHERLLEKYSHLRSARISTFRTFGSSSLPGRNYDDYLYRNRGNDRQETSLAEQSRAAIGSSDETYRWMGNEESFEPLPRGVSSVMQHSRNDTMPFVHAEKFEPVKVYDHPVFGPTPAYIRPLFKNKIKHQKKILSDDSDHENETKITTNDNNNNNNNNNNNVSDHKPFGYVSYKSWRTKHEHLVPVDPLLFSIYTQRSNGSLQSYGQSLYVLHGRQKRDRQISHSERLPTIPPSVTASIEVDIFDENSTSSKHQYNTLHSQSTSSIISEKPSESVSTGNKSHRPILSALHLLRVNSNPTIIQPLSPRTETKITLPASISLIQNASILSSQDSLDTSTSVTIPDALNSPSISLSNSRPSSTMPYQTLSSIADNPSTIVTPLSKSTTSLHQRKDVSSDDDDDDSDDVILSNSDSDNDDDGKQTRGRQEKL
ncbi:unnamed protein product [Adineta steineri]|uniref:Uncharacterized protein n=1 Tax=Adineta steineri TaxID=433720 RepID=A0A818G123_9BILA|nr:unnamed protein product [Adineta steineri]